MAEHNKIDTINGKQLIRYGRQIFSEMHEIVIE
jgi:hypothetical protein